MKIALTIGSIAIVLLALLTAFCQGRLSMREEGEIRYSDTVLPDGVEYPGKLCGVTFDYSAGSMERHTEFYIEVTPDEIISCSYWLPFRNNITVREHANISARRWEQLERIILILFPEMEPYEEEQLPAEDSSEREYLLDGGFKKNLFLTWMTEEGKAEVRYIAPSDRKFTTLFLLLQEIAHPIGRKIPWYE
ncbi:MAG: hypothetical protein IJG67_06890 [Oscillospiraceae bacterium]|nr:hypothetical protein [Oscillospiraceae bacterium]